MQNKAWEHLYLYFSEQQKLYANLVSEELVALLSSLLASSENETDIQEINQDQLMIEVTNYFSDTQTALCNNLSFCQENLNPLIKRQELDYLMSALIFHCDESVLTRTLNQVLSKISCDCEPKLHSPTFVIKSKWPSIQNEWLQCRDGGERFFNQLNELLNTPSDYALAIEVYYLCLKQGFIGSYVNVPTEVDQLIATLTKTISDNQSAYIAPTNLDAILKDDKEPTIGDEYATSP